MNRFICFSLPFFLFALFSCRPTYQADPAIIAELPDKVDFNFHIKPILSDRCFKCHGPDANQRKAGLRLDLQKDAFAKTKSEQSRENYILDPGNLASSEFFQRIISKEEGYQMPDPASNLSLSSYEIALIARWIEQGAEYKDHWAFVPPEKSELPPIKKNDWPLEDWDHFILAEMEAKGLAPSGQASKETLLRRISMDITGLPPTSQAIDNFLSDSSPDAYSQAVDRLLSSPHYGERMATAWLDVARYADTHGYQDDGKRNTWPWRDWVIRAFNDNMPYDQFLTWQLAGDLLPEPTRDQLLATCFNRNHPQNQEGGVVDEEYRVEYVADRTATLGTAFLGLTVECARCHDHKYDPISQKEYYSLSAFFNNNHDTGIVPYNGEASPTVILPSAEAEKTLAEIESLKASLQEALLPENYIKSFEKWLAKNSRREGQSFNSSFGLLADFDFDQEFKVRDKSLPLQKKPKVYRETNPAITYGYINQVKGKVDAKLIGDNDSRPQLVEGVSGKGLQFFGDCGVRFHEDLEFDKHQAFSVSIWVKLLKEGQYGPIFNKANGDFEGYRGWGCHLHTDGTLSFQLNHVWPGSAIEVKTREKLPLGEWTHIVMAYDGSSKAKGLEIYVNGSKPTFTVLADHLEKSLLHGVGGSNQYIMPVMLGKENQKTILEIVMDEFKVYDRKLSSLEIKTLYREFAEGTRGEAPDHKELLEYYLLSGKDKRYNQNWASLTDVRKEENLLMTDQLEVMIMRERKVPLSTFVLDRGAYDMPGEEVRADFPSFFKPQETKGNLNRMDLCNWLVHQDNPLTSRVMVNRVWAMFLGKGLVSTQADFGSQGRLPSHPKLLDWLAVDFREHGWDIKRLIRQLVLSATYRQVSVPAEGLEAVDPENRYYSYYSPQRLSAEMIRDQALAVSGLLVPKIGGPSVYPYQPDGLWKAFAYRNQNNYQTSEGEGLYRRSMYSYWKRSVPPPAMMNFDAPERYFCVVNRQKTSTPLQSLVLMNDPTYVEAARVFGERMIKEGGDALESRIAFAFKALIGRMPRKAEKILMIDLYNREYEGFLAEPERVEAWLSTGAYPQNQDLNQVEWASASVLASTLMNFDEFIMKR